MRYNASTFIPYGTEVSRRGTDRSSMETLLLSCLQAQLVIGRVIKAYLSPQTRNDLIWEIRKIAPKECKIDATAD
jgi:hypothetical protein